MPAKGFRLTHCKRGHERTPENVDKWRKCKRCFQLEENIQKRAAYHRTPDRKNKQRERSSRPDAVLKNLNARRERFYGWSPKRVEEYTELQKNCCAICGETFIKTPHADHAHTQPPSPRGLLCHGCNNGIGRFRDRPEVCESAAEYLRKWGNIYGDILTQ